MTLKVLFTLVLSFYILLIGIRAISDEDGESRYSVKIEPSSTILQNPSIQGAYWTSSRFDTPPSAVIYYKDSSTDNYMFYVAFSGGYPEEPKDDDNHDVIITINSGEQSCEVKTPAVPDQDDALRWNVSFDSSKFDEKCLLFSNQDDGDEIEYSFKIKWDIESGEMVSSRNSLYLNNAFPEGYPSLEASIKYSNTLDDTLSEDTTNTLPLAGSTISVELTSSSDSPFDCDAILVLYFKENGKNSIAGKTGPQGEDNKFSDDDVHLLFTIIQSKPGHDYYLTVLIESCFVANTDIIVNYQYPIIIDNTKQKSIQFDKRFVLSHVSSSMGESGNAQLSLSSFVIYNEAIMCTATVTYKVKDAPSNSDDKVVIQLPSFNFPDSEKITEYEIIYKDLFILVENYLFYRLETPVVLSTITNVLIRLSTAGAGSGEEIETEYSTHCDDFIGALCQQKQNCSSSFYDLGQCSHRGIVEDLEGQCGMCACRDSWTGQDCSTCEQPECPSDKVAKTYTGNGKCFQVCVGNEETDSCSNNGWVLPGGGCVCSGGWKGDDCSIKVNPCSTSCDESTAVCGATGECVCRNPQDGWQLLPKPLGANKQSCHRPCTCLNGQCDWSTGIMTCQCNPGSSGTLCQNPAVKEECTIAFPSRSICDKGHLQCFEGNEMCDCLENWTTDKKEEKDGGRWCNRCQLHDFCNSEHTHRVTYTASRCSNKVCVCNKGWTGLKCDRNAAYAEIVFDPSDVPTLTMNDPVAYADIIIKYLSEYMAANGPFLKGQLTPEMVEEWLSVYDSSVETSPPTLLTSTGGMIMSILSSLLGLPAQDEQYECTDGKLSFLNRKYACIKKVKFIIEIDSQSVLDSMPASGEFNVLNSDLSSLFNTWDDSITKMPDDTSLGSDIFKSIGAPSSQSIYDELYCSKFTNETLPEPCRQNIAFKDGTWSNEADADDAIFNVMPSSPSESSSTNIGIVVGVIAGVVALFIIGILVICRLKKTKKACFSPKESKRRSSRTSKGAEISMASDRSQQGSVTPLSAPNKTPSSLPSPVAMSSSKSSSTEDGQAAAPQKPLPEGWKLLHDPNSGKNYYYNEKTLTSSWNHPNDAPSSAW